MRAFRSGDRCALTFFAHIPLSPQHLCTVSNSNGMEAKFKFIRIQHNAETSWSLFSPQHVESIRSLCPVKSVCWGIAGRGTTTNRRLAPSPSSSKAMLKISRLRMVSWTLPTVNLSSPRPSCAVRSKGIRKSRLQARPYGRAHSVPLLPGDTHPRHRCISHSHI